MKVKILLSIIFALYIVAKVQGQIPKTINFQGILVDTDTNEKFVSNGPIPFALSIWDAETEGIKLWDEIQTVEVDDGRYNLNLGDDDPLDILDFDKPYYLEISINGEKLTPRIRLTSTAYILNKRIRQLIENGEIDGSIVGSGVDAGNITTGTLPNEVLNSNLADLASDGKLDGANVGNGIDADKITSGTVSSLRLPDELRILFNDLSDDGRISSQLLGSSEGNLSVDNQLGIGITDFEDGTNVIAIANGSAPSASIADGVQLYADNVSMSSELRVRDEAGNITTLSPHNFSLSPRSEPLSWSYYSENPNLGKRINVDMLRVVRLIEQLSGETLIFIAPISESGSQNTQTELGDIKKLIPAQDGFENNGITDIR